MSKQFRAIELDDGGFPTRLAPVDATPRPPDPLDQLAQLVRQIYVVIRRNVTGDMDYGRDPIPRYDGGVDRWNKRYKPVWPKVAAHIARLSANPVAYIRCQFHGRNRHGKIVKPDQLCSPAAVDKFERYRRDAVTMLRGALESQSTSMRAEMCVLEVSGKTPIVAIEMAVMNIAAVNASALLRYCVGEEYHLPAVMRRWHNEALLQYVFEMAAYDQAWAGWLPKSLQEEGKDLLMRLLS